MTIVAMMAAMIDGCDEMIVAMIADTMAARMIAATMSVM